jgi:hypothetical protein
MKRIIIVFMAIMPVLCMAQRVQSVDFFPEGDNVVITYKSIDDATTMDLYLSENDGDWQKLNHVSGDVGANIPAGDHRIVWDIYKEKPKGVSDNVRFAIVPDYAGPAEEDLPKGFPYYNSVIRGNKAYGASRENYSSKYAGDIRKGTWASATDNISYTLVVFEYDFITGEMKQIYSTDWSGRVSRREPSGHAVGYSFPVVKQPSHRMKIDKKGRVCLDKTVIVE